ncbi:hypothetical protein G7Z17_g9362 [Cylindrodendrum hubeiense]|uniref:F-box domain-containing protein n=1 Tax=Cylindrodendrum hubeiense TaxID=595255 RepID=A0A9P5H4R1_9HYPO|nr:hypothetical protein G7Z17_g9362 [Cylindrodendrum hubeiense]
MLVEWKPLVQPPPPALPRWMHCATAAPHALRWPGVHWRPLASTGEAHPAPPGRAIGPSTRAPRPQRKMAMLNSHRARIVPCPRRIHIHHHCVIILSSFCHQFVIIWPQEPCRRFTLIASTMPQLLNLPTEILQAICCSLCSHCPGHGESWKTSRRALSYLSQTCSTLQDIAQPTLYHSLDPFRGNPVPLLQTLDGRPDLAAKVQEMYVGVDWDLSESISPEDVVFCEALMNKNPKEDGSLVQFSPNWSTQDRGAGNDSGLFAFEPEAALAALALTQIPNVQSLELECGYFWDFPFCTPGSLPCLTQLTFRHADTELGQDLAAIKHVLAAAPHLNILNGHMISRVSGNFSHHNVVELNLTFSHLEAEEFEALMTGLIKLSSFAYESGGAIISDTEETTPVKISQALHIRSNTLQHVLLDFEEAFFIDGIGPEDVITSLKAMKHLKTLTLSCMAIYADDDESTDETRLVNLLPPSIEILTIRNLYTHKLNDMLRLGEMVPTLFPNLKKVHVPGIEVDKLAVVQAAFSTSKVTVSL